MFLTALMFVVAIALSAIAAFYSIVGLAAIFAAAVMPIVIMGTVLEVAKLTVTVWLHEYWRECRLIMKLYLVPAVVVLMIITSMGIFGFLSKAHIEQAVPTGDVAARVMLLDERITNERETIANARSLLRQLDDAVMGIQTGSGREIRGADGSIKIENPAERALQVRRAQARDRAALTATIEQAQQRIVSLQEERAPIASQLREVEAKVGPIKYIAALVYGDDPDSNLLERAVRWVIIVLVVVFDPLAIMMLLAATESRRWHLDRRSQETNHDDVVPTVVPAGSMSEKDLDTTVSRTDVVATTVDHGPVSETLDHDEREHETSMITVPESQDKPEDCDEIIEQEANAEIKQCMRQWKAANPGHTVKEQRHLLALGLIDHLPWMDLLPPTIPKSGHGSEFPSDPRRGDVFMRTDSVPNQLYKYNGDKWISVPRDLSDNLAYDEKYIDYLISEIDAGRYDPEFLSPSEADQITQRLARSRAV